jgi:D-threo-aldose 1-dehydrogenase
VDEQAVMAKRPFGRTGLEVTPLCVGGFPLGNCADEVGFSVPLERALATIRAVFDGPINFLDTSASYCDSEARIGQAIRERGGLPKGFVLATKADRDPETKDFSADIARRSVERSLERLGLDRLQVLYLHDAEYANQTFEEITAPGGTLEALVRLKQEGIVQALGIAAGPVDMMIRYVETGLFDAMLTHNRYTLVTRVAEPLIEAAHRRGMAVVNAAAFSSGILAQGLRAHPNYLYRAAPAAVAERVQQMEEICARYGVPLAAAALQRSLRDARITSTVVGMTRPERIAENVALAAVPIPDAIWPELDALTIADFDPQARG